MSKRHLSDNSIVRASSSKTKRIGVAHNNDDYGPSVLWTWSMDKQQAIAACKQEFPADEEIIGVPECPDCGALSDIKYRWNDEMWVCGCCGYCEMADSPDKLPGRTDSAPHRTKNEEDN